ncbi:hypothetical protein [Brevibacterium oceani]|uniref:hypothetical protein n=1 Tax=Brevibacterium oceani TaxID=358099 RepID=UPI0015E6AF39|nr:hypothetical protein [Brevibacterium oceani]
MSTKVHDAFRLPADVDVLALPAQLSAAILPARLRADAQEIYDAAIHNADRFSAHRDITRMPRSRKRPTSDLTPLYSPEWPWISAIQILAQHERDESPSSTFHDRHRFGVRLVRDPEDHRVLALVDAPHSSIREAFEAFAVEHGWADWHYQNQTDQPEDVPDDEWDERRRSWDRALFDAEGTEDAEIRIRVAPMLSHTTSPTVMGGVFGDEQAAIDRIEVRTPAQRLSRLLLDAAVNDAGPENGQDAIRLAIDARDALRRAISDDHRAWLEALAQMPDVGVDQLRLPREGDEPVITHPFDEEALHSTASRIIASAASEAGGPS